MSEKLTKAQERALDRLMAIHSRVGNLFGAHAVHLGVSTAATLRKMERTGLVKIDRQAVNCFRYSLTEAGLQRQASKPNQIEATR
jgi:hypothetical protein